jgi:hypothetical protein
MKENPSSPIPARPSAQPLSETAPKATLLQVLMSVAAAFFGVQSERNRVRDFSQNSAVPYIVVGLVMTFALVGVLWLVVKLILHAAAP